MSDNTNTPLVVLSKYEKNKPHINKYRKKRYSQDEEYRKKVIEDSTIYNKIRYANDPEFRQRMKDNVASYRLRKKIESLQTHNVICS